MAFPRTQFYTSASLVSRTLSKLRIAPTTNSYNSILFTSPAADDYMAVLVAPQFLTGGHYRSNPFADATPNMDQIKDLQKNVGNLVRLENPDCIAAYGGPLVTDYRNVLLVSGDYSSPNDTIVYVFQHAVVDGAFRDGWVTDVDPNHWSFGEQACAGDVLAQKDPIYGFDCWGGEESHQISVGVSYCLAEPAAAACSVDVSTTLLGVVIAFNAAKLLCLLVTMLLPRFEPLVTLGDALASFISQPDPHTEGQGLLSAADVRDGAWMHTPSAQPPKPRKWRQPGRSWWRAAGPGRWCLNLGVVLLVMLAGVVILALTFYWDGGSSEWSQGLGQDNPASLVSATENLPRLATVVIANIPQLLVSGAYLAYNSILTSMVVAREYSLHAASGASIEGLALRVSRPVKGSTQRGRHHLSLPYAYAVPLLAASALLHWLLSQAIFVVQVAAYDNTGAYVRGGNIAGCGWSVRAMVGAAVLGLAMLLALVALASFGRLRRGIPVAGSCSAALAAACHARVGDVGAELRAVRFGVLETVTVSGRIVERVGFGSGHVAPLKDGGEYV